VLLARPHTLPDGIGWFSHGLLDPADSGHPDAVQQALASVKDELDRGVAVGSTADADLVLVVRELGDLKPDALNASERHRRDRASLPSSAPRSQRTAGRRDAQDPSVYGPANALDLLAEVVRTLA